MGDVLTDGSRPVHLVTTAAAHEGRGHSARTVALGEALAAAGAGPVSVRILRGSWTDGQTATLRAAGVVVAPSASPPTGAVVVADLPDPAEAVGLAPPERLALFDDGDRFAGSCALVVQPSMPRWRGSGSAGRVLEGYAWAPVAEAWRTARPASAPSASTSDPPRIVVCFGGSDPAGVTGRVAPALAADPRWRTVPVVGRDHGGALPASLDVARDPADLPGLVAGSDLAVIGAGTMKFEVGCLGRAMALLAVADDQLPVGPPFAATGAAVWLGDGRTVDPGDVVDAVAALVADAGRRTTLARTAWTLVDGEGAARLASEIAALARS